jgi:hypothetical protein
MEFLSSKEVSISGGYLTKNGDMKSPVNHSEFVAAQKEANVLCMLAAKVTLTDFTVKKVPLFSDLMEEVRRENLAAERVLHIDVPVEPARPTASKLAEEALSWLNFEQGKSKVEKVNDMLQKFNIISDFEKVGLYFDGGIVKLQRIYTMKEISDAMLILVPHLS